MFVAFTTGTPAPGLTVKLGDSDTVITAATDRLEAFRELAAGEHRITVSGNHADARLIVRSIPEIFDYPPCANSHVPENGSYGWDFMKKHILYAVTTLNGGTLPGDALPEAKARGLKWLANFGVDAPGDPAELRDRMEKTAGMTQPQYDGFTSDELFFGRATIGNYTQALKLLRNPQNRLVYTWIVGKPSIHSLHTDFMSACLNVSRGRGRLLFEAYCHPQDNEQAAAAYLDDMIGETMRRFNAFFPNAAAGTGIIFGNFNQIPIISLEHNPAVDFKYFLDMQVNLIANSPDFKDLATTGYWGTYYGDEELVRWSFKLMRHYAVEGHKEMLSARYGFKYNPGFLANGDFADGLNGLDRVAGRRRLHPHGHHRRLRQEQPRPLGWRQRGRHGLRHGPKCRPAQPHQPNRPGSASGKSLLPAVCHRRLQGCHRQEIQPAPIRHPCGTGRRRDPRRQGVRPCRPAQDRPRTSRTRASPRSTSTASSSAPSPPLKSSLSTTNRRARAKNSSSTSFS